MRRLAFILAFLVGCSTANSADEATDRSAREVVAGRGHTYALNPDQSRLYVIVRTDPDALLAGLGHEHTVVATGWEGVVNWPKGTDPADCRVHISVPVKGLVVDPDGYRALAGLPGETPDEDKQKIVTNIRGDRVLDAAVWSDVMFDATSCQAVGSVVNVSGNLTMHGQTVPVTVPMQIDDDANGFHAIGRLEFKGSDWAMQPFRAAAGTIRHSDHLEMRIDLKGDRS
jgi:polyisoprenoid-binding protein YceI